MSRQGTPKTLIALVGLLVFGLAAPGTALAAPTQDSPASIQAPPDPALEGQTLQGNDGTYSGVPPGDQLMLDRQWRRCDGVGASCEDITGADDADYTLSAADIGSTVRYRVEATCGTAICTPTTSESSQTVVVTQAEPLVSRAGRTLTAGAPEVGTPPPTVSYRWRRCTGTAPGDCSDVSGTEGAGQTFKLASADIDRRLRVRVTIVNEAGTFSKESAPSEVIAAAPPTPTSAPVVSGTAREGSPLASTLGTWSGEGPISYLRNWVRCSGTGISSCTLISGATLATYRATAADVGKRLRIGVFAEGLGGRVVFSASTAVVVSSSPDLLSPFPRIAIAGRARRSSTLITKFVVRAPRGSRVSVRCRGHGCFFRRVSARSGRRAVRFRRLQRVFPAGTAVEVFVTKRGKIGKYTRFRFRRRRPPSRADGCLNPGAKRPKPCPGR